MCDHTDLASCCKNPAAQIRPGLPQTPLFPLLYTIILFDQTYPFFAWLSPSFRFVLLHHDPFASGHALLRLYPFYSRPASFHLNPVPSASPFCTVIPLSQVPLPFCIIIPFAQPPSFCTMIPFIQPPPSLNQHPFYSVVAFIHSSLSLVPFNQTLLSSTLPLTHRDNVEKSRRPYTSGGSY